MGDPFIGSLISAGIGLAKKAGSFIIKKLSKKGALKQMGTTAVKATGALAGTAAATAAGVKLAGVGGEEGRPKRRAKGITGRELKGFKKVTRLLKSVGMHPRGLGRSRRIPAHGHINV
ncbi:MAG: hypothetical protein ACRESV_03045 [Nevskiales bacterium]